MGDNQPYRGDGRQPSRRAARSGPEKIRDCG
jgi:hypothetical protein